MFRFPPSRNATLVLWSILLAAQTMAPAAADGPAPAGGSQVVQDLAGQVDGRGTVRVGSFAPTGQLRTGWGFLTTDDALGVEVIFNIFEAATGELLISTN